MMQEDKELEMLKRIHEAGFKKFVLIRGICFWGLPMGLVFCTLLLTNFGFPEGYTIPTSIYLKGVLLISAISILSGAIWGIVMWWFLMKRYKRMEQ